MKKVAIIIDDNSLSFKYRNNKPSKDNLLNTNVISNNELIFSDEYLNENEKIVGLFISDLAKEKGITNISVSSCELGELVFDLLKNLNNIECFTITNNENLSYALCEKIAKSKNIKKLNCYGIPTFMIEMLDKANIQVDSRNEVLFTSNFTAENNLSSFSKIYYKSAVKISTILEEEDLNDFNTFCDINRYLRVISFEKYSFEGIKAISEILINNKEKNIIIEIHEDLNDGDDIVKLKNLNKELKKHKIRVVLVYSKDYLEQNYLQQIIFTTLKLCSILIFVIISSVFGYIFYNNFSSEVKYENMVDELALLVEEETEYVEEEIDDDEVETIDPETGEKKKTRTREVLTSNYDKLLEINPDTVGWLKVLGTKINYPVVRATDNKYYLERDFYQKKDYSGWVFMDYRNGIDILDDNTIIYAHNRYTSGVMFGTLTNTRKKSWYSNEENLYITFNTLHGQFKWKVFSIYSIDVTSDYLLTNFLNDNDRLKFFNMLKNRSQVKLDTEVTAKDKILTLSTCLDNDKRLVVHAVLQ